VTRKTYCVLCHYLSPNEDLHVSCVLCRAPPESQVLRKCTQLPSWCMYNLKVSVDVRTSRGNCLSRCPAGMAVTFVRVHLVSRPGPHREEARIER